MISIDFAAAILLLLMIAQVLLAQAEEIANDSVKKALLLRSRQIVWAVALQLDQAQRLKDWGVTSTIKIPALSIPGIVLEECSLEVGAGEVRMSITARDLFDNNISVAATAETIYTGSFEVPCGQETEVEA